MVTIISWKIEVRALKTLIFLTGQSGCGKSTIATKFDSSAFRVDVDAIQYEAARRAFPFARKTEFMNWFLWPQHPDTFDAVPLISLSLRAIYPTLLSEESHVQSVLIEGCFLAHDWFRGALETVLSGAGHAFGSTCHFYLKQSSNVVLGQIRERSARTKNEAQLKVFKDEAAIEHNSRWFSEFLCEEWQHFDDKHLLEIEIKRCLEQ